MKRVLTSLFTMLLLFAVGAQADYTIGGRVQGSSAFKDGDLVVFEAASSIANAGYYIKETSSNSYAWQQGFDQASVWKVVVSSTTSTSFGTGTYYYLQNVQSGKYMAGTNTAPTTVESQSDAVLIAFYGKDTPWTWGKYDDQVNNTVHWDDNSVAIRLISGSSDFWLANDIGNRESGALPNNGQVHNFMWNVSYAVDNTPTPTPTNKIITVGEGQGVVLGNYLTDVSQLETGNYLLVVNSVNQAGNYVYQDQTDFSIKREAAKTGSSSYGEKNVVRFTVTGNQEDASGAVTGKYVKLQGLNGQYISVTSSGNTPVNSAAEATTFLATKTTSGIESIYLQDSTNTGNYFNGITEGILKWTNGQGDWSKYAVYSVSVEKVSTIVWNVVDASGATVATDTLKNCVVGTQYTTSLASYAGVTLNTPTVEATADDQTISTTFTINEDVFPFKFTTANDTTWYQLTIQRNPVKYSQYNAETKHVANTTTAPATVTDIDRFAFVGTPFGFQIINRAAGAAAPFGPATATNNMKLVAGATADAASLVYENNSGHQVFRFANASLGYVNDVNGELGVWLNSAGATDAGSSFAFTDVTPYEAASRVEINGLYYNLSADGTATVTYPSEQRPWDLKSNAYTGDITIPATVIYNGNRYNVTATDQDAFRFSTITSVTFSEGLLTIGPASFNNCDQLTEVVLPNSVTTTANDDPFGGCDKLKKFTIGSGIKTVNQGLTYGSPIDTVYIYATSVPAGGLYAFSTSPVIHVYPEMVSKFKSATYWNGYNYVGDLVRDDYTYDEAKAYVDELNTAAETLVGGTDPGYYNAEALAAYKQALSEASSLSENASASELSAAVQNLYKLQSTLSVNSLTEGYYFIATAGNYSSNNEEDKYALYNDSGYVKWKAYDKSADELYYISQGTDGWYIYNVKDKSYIDKGTGSYGYGDKFATSKTKDNVHNFYITTEGSGKYAIKSPNYCFVLNPSHTAAPAGTSGYLSIWGTVSEAAQYGKNVWYLHAVSEEEADELINGSVPDGYVASLVNGYYYIVAGWDGMSLETRTVGEGEYLYKHGNFAAPAKVDDLSLGQIFKVKSVSDTTFTIQNVATGNYVGAYNAEGTEGTTLAFAATATAYNNYIYPWTKSPNATTDTGSDPYAPSFVVFDTSASENEWSGRWTGQGWNVHSAITDRVAHAFKFYKVDSLVTEYLANKDYYDGLLTYTNILNNTPTAAQDGDVVGNFKGPWIDGTERTAVAGYETVQNLKDSLSAAIDAYKANPSDETLAAMKLWGDTVNLKWAPLTDGVYFITPRFGDDQTKSAVSLTIDTADSTAWRKPLAETDANFMFEVKITKSHTDSILGTVPDSMTIKNVGTGLYLGKIVGSNWAYQTEPVQIGYITFTGSQFYSETKHAHCFGLNVGGKLMTFAQNENGSAITTTNGTYAWRESWMFRPADKYYEQYQKIDEARSALREVIAANDSVQFGTDPGYYTEASVSALNEAVAAGQQALASTDVAAVTKASDAITAAAAALKTVPITEGYYTIYVDNENIAANNKSDKAMYFNSTANEVYWGEYVKGDAKFVMKVTPGATEGTYTVQNIANGLYGGNATAFCGHVPVTPTPNALKFKLYAGTGSFVITGSDGAWDYCPQGNPSGTADGPSYVWAYNGDRTANGGKPHLEWTWRLKALTDTAVVDTMLANSLATVVESMSEVTPGTDPNTYSEEAAKAYNAALTAAKAVAESGTVAEKAAAMKSLFATSASVTLNELTDGYYFIASAGNGPGYYTGSTVPSTNINLEDKDAIYNANGIVSWKAFDRTDKSQVYRITANANGGYDVYSIADSSYIDKGARSYNTQISTSATPTTAQIFTIAAAGSGKYTITWSGNGNVYALDHSHNGSTAATGTLNVWGNNGEAVKFGINQWYVHALTQDEIDSFAKSVAQESLAKAIEGDAGIADTTGASAVAKAYAEALATARALAAEPAGVHSDAEYEAALTAYQQAKAAYQEEQIQSGIAQAKWVLENTPTATEDTDLGSMGGTWIDGTERTAVAGVETVQEYKDSLQAAITAIEDTITEANIQNLQKWGNIVYAKWAPLTDGVYFLIPRYGDDQTASVISMTIDTADSTAWRKPLTSTDPNFMFEVKITASHTDSILGTVPDSMTIRNIGTGLYLGKLVGSTWAYQAEPVNIGYTTFTGNQFYSDTKHAHCFGLNINDQFMTFSRSSSGSAITVGTTRTYAWMRAWMFRPAEKEYEEYEANKEFLNFANQVQASLATVTPANHHDNNKSKGRSFLLGNEKLGVDGLATSIDAINALQAAYDTLVSAYQSGKSVSELTSEIAAVNAAKAVVDKKSNPMESGLYYIVAVYGDDTDSIPGGLVLTANGVQGNTNALSKTAFKATDANQIFQVTLLDSGKVTLQNAATGKYVGAVADGKWIFSDDAVELNIENSNGGRYWWVWADGATVAARSCSFTLTNDSAQAINSSTAANTQSGVYTVPASGNISAWFCSWAFRPVGDSINIDALNSTIESLAGAYNSLVSSDEVGYYKKENVDAFKALYAEAVAQQAADTLTSIQKSTLSASLLAAYNKALSVRNEVTTGYYIIRNTAKGFGSNVNAIFVDEDGSVKWKAFDANDAKQFVFKVEDLDSTITINEEAHKLYTFQSVATEKYLSYGSAVQRGNATSNTTPWGITVSYSSAAPQALIQPVWMTRLALAQCYGVNTTAATSGQVRQASAFNADADSAIFTWVFVRADEYMQEDSIVDVYDIAADASAPAEGTTYVVKNAYNNKYLSTNGGTVDVVNTIAKSEIWTIEASGKTADGQPTYYLKSANKANDAEAYWQYEDYGSKTWDATTPYDGYDWFGYAGLNAAFGPAATAQEFTILPATANANPDTRTGVAKDKEPKGYVLTAAAKVMDMFYKLGVQGSQAALEPYNEDVAWLFYEATGISDPDSALQIALNTYGQKEMKGGTAPGYYSAGAVDEYNEIVADAKTAQEGTTAEKRASVQALLATDTLTFEVNPIAEGYYYIVSAGNGPGYSGGPYNNEEKFALYNNDGKVHFAAYDQNDTKYVYQITGSGDTLMVKNIQDNSYIASYTGEYGCNVLTSDGAATGQVFTWEKEGKFAVNAADKQYVWATAGNHNGSTEASGQLTIWGTPVEAGTYGVNLWYLVPCSDEMIEKITGIGGIAAGGNGTSVVAGQGKVTVTSDKAQTILVVSTSGAVVARQQVAAGETTSIYLVPGVYIVNGKKVAVK